MQLMRLSFADRLHNGAKLLNDHTEAIPPVGWAEHTAQHMPQFGVHITGLDRVMGP